MNTAHGSLSDTIGQFITTPHTVVEMIPEIGVDAFVLFSVLRYHTNRRGHSFPGYSLLVVETGISRNRIARAIRALEKADLLTRTKRFAASTVYTLKMPSKKTGLLGALSEDLISENISEPEFIEDDTENDDDCDDTVVTEQDSSSHESCPPVVLEQDSNKINLTRLSLTRLNTSREKEKTENQKPVSPLEKKEGGENPLVCESSAGEKEESERCSAAARKSEYLRRIERATSVGMMNAAQDVYGLVDYPDDVRDIIREVCSLWNLRPPMLRGRAKQGSQASFWIGAARELIDACGEFGLDAIRYERKRFERHMSEHGGLAPYTVAGPKQLVNTVRAASGEMRTQAKQKDVAEKLPPGITMAYLQSLAKSMKGASEVHIGGHRIK